MAALVKEAAGAGELGSNLGEGVVAAAYSRGLSAIKAAVAAMTADSGAEALVAGFIRSF